MAGSLAPTLNEAGAPNDIDLMRKQTGIPDPAINPQLKAALTGNTWQERFGNYLSDTNWGDVGEALARSAATFSQPLRQAFNAYDASQGTLADNSRVALAQATRVPTDVAAGVVGLPAAASTVKQLIFGGDPLPAAEGSAQAAGAISDFGKSYAEPIAGRPLTDDVLRGTPAEMAANMQRNLYGALIPLPTKFTVPVINAATRLTKAADDVLTGTNLIQKSTSIAAQTLEAFTPLAVSYSPSVKTMMTNAAVQGAMTPLAEAAFKSMAPAQQQAEAGQLQADEVAKQGTAVNTQGWTQAANVSSAVDAATKPPNVIQAGGLPSTGNPADDLLIAGSIIATGYAGWKFRNVIARTAFGYDPKVLADRETIQPKLTQLAQQTNQGTASLHKTIENTLRADPNYTRNQVDDIIARNKEDIASRTGAAVSTKEDMWMYDGKYMDSNVRSVPGNDMFKAHNELSDAQKEGANKLLWARQELDDRARMVAAQLNRPATNPLFAGTPARNLAGYTNRDLQLIVNTYSADPAIANVERMFRDVVDKAGDYMADQKGMHPTEWARFHSDNPYYVPRKDVDQKSFMDPRRPVKTIDPATGADVNRGVATFEELGNAMGNVPAYMDEVFRRTEGMKGKRDFFEFAQRQIAQGNTYLNKVFPELGNKTILGRSGKLGPEASERMVPWRDSNGTKRYTEVNDIVLRDALNGIGNPSMLQLQSGILSHLTKYYESGAVGPLSLVNLTMFPPKSALYAMTFGSIAPTERGIAKGYLDRMAQDAFGIRLPGDVSGIAGLPYHALKNIGEMLVDRGARVLHNSVITDGILTKAFDKASLEAAAQRMSAWYKTTHSHAMREAGLAGPASQDVVDTAKMYKDPGGALKPQTGFWGGAAKTHDFVNDLMRAISSSPASVIRAVNKDVEPWRLNSAIRNLSGDPGRAGAWRNAKWVAYGVNATPWGNVYIQAIAKLMEAGKSWDNALYTAQGAATFGATVAMASMWNASLGPEYTKHQHFERSPDDVSQNIYIGIPGLPATQGLYIPIDPGMRPVKLAAEALVGLHLGLFDGTLFKPENEAERRANEEAVHLKYGAPREGSVSRSVLQQFLIPPLPGVVQTGFALGGVQLRGYGDARVPDTRSTQGFADDDLIKQFTPGVTAEVFRGIGAGLADFVLKFYSGMHRDLDPNAASIKNETKTWGEALHTQIQESALRGKDSTSELGSYPLLSGFHRYVPSQEANAQLVKQKLDVIKEVNRQFQLTTEKGGPRETLGNKRSGVADYIGTQPAQPQDLATLRFAEDVNTLYKELQPVLSQNKVLYNQLSSLKGSNLYTPREKRGMEEMLGRDITDLNRRMLVDIQRYESILSQRYGQKIDFSKKFNPGSSLSKQ